MRTCAPSGTRDEQDRTAVTSLAYRTTAVAQWSTRVAGSRCAAPLISTAGAPAHQAGHRRAVGADIHDRPAAPFVDIPDPGGRGGIPEVGLDDPDVADDAVGQQLPKRPRLRMASVHEGFHAEHTVRSARLERLEGLDGVEGEGLLAQDMLARLGATDRPVEVEMVGQG